MGSDREVLTGLVVVQRFARWRGRRCVSDDGAADGDVEGPFRSRDGEEGEDDGDHGDVRRWSRGGSPRSRLRGGRGSPAGRAARWFRRQGSWQQRSAGSARRKRLLYGARRALVGGWRRQEGSEGRDG